MKRHPGEMKYRPGERVRTARYMCLRDTQIGKGQRGVIVGLSAWKDNWRVLLDAGHYFGTAEFTIPESDLELLSPLECLAEAAE